MKVAVNTRKPNIDHKWSGRKVIDFKQIPAVGEYFALSVDSPWYKVLVVTHCPFSDADCDAEILGIESSQQDTIHEAYKPYMKD